MLETIHQFNAVVAQDPIFWFCALAGSGMFAIQFILTLFGLSQEEGMEHAADAGNFEWLSKQAITGFVMFFGWVGLTCRKEFAFSGLAAGAFAFVGGSLALFTVALLFRWAKKLKSSGTVFRIEEAIGKEATIYQRIPFGGRGKISVSLNHFTHEIEAISNEEEDLPSFTLVQIIQKLDEKTVIVAKTK